MEDTRLRLQQQRNLAELGRPDAEITRLDGELAAIDAAGGPPAGIEIIPPDKLRPLRTVGLVALGAYLLSIAARFFRSR